MSPRRLSFGSAPPWFAGIEIVDWQGEVKDLNFITGGDVARTLLVDDIAAYVHEDQRAQWIEIAPFAAPYPETDRELARVAALLARRARELA